MFDTRLTYCSTPEDANLTLAHEITGISLSHDSIKLEVLLGGCGVQIKDVDRGQELGQR